MGGTPSPLLWAMAYDPAVVRVREGAGAATPTFVDDTSAEVQGPAQALAAQLPLLATSHAAALHVDGRARRGARRGARFGRSRWTARK
eukprot:11513103-Alexandrium_andersonii.AAC.1